MTTLNLQIAAGGDDGYCPITGTFEDSQDYVIFGNAAASIDTWLRFTNVTIPFGAVINTAVLTFTSDSNLLADTVRVNIYAEKAANPAAPSTCADLWARTRTTAYVAWDFGTDWAPEDEVASPDISTVIQEVIDQGGWASGNAIQILIDDDGSTDTARRQSYSYEDTPAKSAQLDITYTSRELWAVPIVF